MSLLAEIGDAARLPTIGLVCTLPVLAQANRRDRGTTADTHMPDLARVLGEGWEDPSR